MLVEYHNSNLADKLNRTLYTRLASLKKRSVGLTINILNDHTAVIIISVSGKKGMATQTIVVCRNIYEISKNAYTWFFQTNQATVKTDNLSDIGQFANKIVSNLKTIVNKLQ